MTNPSRIAISLFLITLIVTVGIWAANPAFCYDCPAYACQTNTECGGCACAKQTGQPWGKCFSVMGH